MIDKERLIKKIEGLLSQQEHLVYSNTDMDELVQWVDSDYTLLKEVLEFLKQ